jgi:uncharacterized protein
MHVLTLFSLLLFALAMTPTDATAQPAPARPSALTTLSVRLRPGQDLKAELDKLVTTHQIGAGLVLTGVGSLTDVSLRLANQDGATAYKGHFEIVSLVGTLSTNGSHLHLSVSDSTGRTIGGHLMPGNRIYTTAELVLGILPDVVYSREPDPAFGYRELVIRKKKK